MRRRAIAVLAAGVALVALAVAVALSASGHRTLDSNRVGFQDFVTEVPPGKEACQPGELLPAGAGRVRVTIADRGVRPTPAVHMTWLDGGRVVARSAFAEGWSEGRITRPLDRVVEREVRGVQWCVANTGRAPVLLAGQPGDSEAFNATLHGERSAGRMRVDYLTRDEVSWWSQIGPITERFGFGKPRHLGGSWTLWAALALAVAAWVLAGRAVLRLAGAEERA